MSYLINRSLHQLYSVSIRLLALLWVQVIEQSTILDLIYYQLTLTLVSESKTNCYSILNCCLNYQATRHILSAINSTSIPSQTLMQTHYCPWDFLDKKRIYRTLDLSSVLKEFLKSQFQHLSLRVLDKRGLFRTLALYMDPVF